MLCWSGSLAEQSKLMISFRSLAHELQTWEQVNRSLRSFPLEWVCCSLADFQRMWLSLIGWLSETVHWSELSLIKVLKPVLKLRTIRCFLGLWELFSSLSPTHWTFHAIFTNSSEGICLNLLKVTPYLKEPLKWLIFLTGSS